MRESPERAARLLGTARVFLEAGDTVPPPTLQAEIRADYERTLAAVRAHLDEEAFAAAWAAGRAMPLEEAIAWAWAAETHQPDDLGRHHQER
jgi:hypothetical protein